MHALSRVRIVNFRSCKDETFNLADFTCLVGCNNAGKSNILVAVKWLLRPSSLSEDDFGDPTTPVLVEGFITGISSEILDVLDEKHRTKIEPYCSEGEFRFQVMQSVPGGRKKDIKTRVWDQGAAENLQEEDAWKDTPTGIPEALYALFPDPIEIGAMEDAAEDAAKFRTTTTIGKLIGGIVAPIQDSHGAALRSELEGLRNKLDADGEERPAEIIEFDTEANKAVALFFPDVSVRLHIPTPELDQLFKTGTIKVYENSDPGREITSMGHGAQRAVQMALVQYLAEKTGAGKLSTRRLLIVEEPELYMHPHGIEQVRSALKKLSLSGYQVLVATHSPLVIGAEDVPDTLLIRKTKTRGTHARKTLRSAVESAMTDYPSQARMLLSLSNSSRLLFADGVVLSEGKTEQRLIPTLFEKHLKKTLGLARIALISQGGVDNTGKSLRILAALDLPCKAVVDLDYAFRGAIQDGFIEQDNSDLEACRSIIQTLSVSSGFSIDESGLPKKGGALTAAEAYALVSADTSAIPHIESLHSKLRENRIWLWTHGCMDQHVGLASKSEIAWADLLRDVDSKGFDCLHDRVGVEKLLEWMANSD